MQGARSTLRIALVLAVTPLGATVIEAQPTTEPAPAAATSGVAGAAASQPAGEILSVQITAVTGMVQVREAEDAPWKKAEVGATIPVGADFRTGVRSSVTFKIPPDQFVTLDRLGTVRVVEAIKSGDKQVKTTLGMKYGRTDYKVEAAEVNHDATIRSPSATLAIRGTQSGGLTDDGHEATGYTTNTKGTFTGSNGHTSPIGGNNQTSEATSKDPNPADHSADKSTTDPQGFFCQKTDAEKQTLFNNPVIGGSVFGQSYIATAGRQAEETETFNGMLVVTPDVTPPETGNFLAFELTWTGPLGSDLDLNITSPLGEHLTNSQITVPSGGRHSFPDQVASGGGGAEIGIWIGSFPLGTYGYQIVNKTGDAVSATVSVVQRTSPSQPEPDVFQTDPITLNSGTLTFSDTIDIPFSSVGARALAASGIPMVNPNLRTAAATPPKVIPTPPRVGPLPPSRPTGPALAVTRTNNSARK